jgi:hypothetical protein
MIRSHLRIASIAPAAISAANNDLEEEGKVSENSKSADEKTLIFFLSTAAVYEV